MLRLAADENFNADILRVLLRRKPTWTLCVCRMSVFREPTTVWYPAGENYSFTNVTTTLHSGFRYFSTARRTSSGVTASMFFSYSVAKR